MDLEFPCGFLRTEKLHERFFTPHGYRFIGVTFKNEMILYNRLAEGDGGSTLSVSECKDFISKNADRLKRFSFMLTQKDTDTNADETEQTTADRG